MKIFLPLFLTLLAATVRAQDNPRAVIEELLAGARAARELPDARKLKGAPGVRGYCALAREGFDVEGMALRMASDAKTGLPYQAWSEATEGERRAYVNAVTSRLATIAATTLKGASTLNFKFEEAVPAPDGRLDVVVRDGDDPQLRTMGNVFLSRIGSGYRVFNVVMGGVNMVFTYQGQFRSFAAKPLPALTGRLNEMSRNNEFAVKAGGICDAPATVSLESLESGEQLRAIEKMPGLGFDPMPGDRPGI